MAVFSKKEIGIEDTAHTILQHFDVAHCESVCCEAKEVLNRGFVKATLNFQLDVYKKWERNEIVY